MRLTYDFAVSVVRRVGTCAHADENTDTSAGNSPTYRRGPIRLLRDSLRPGQQGRRRPVQQVVQGGLAGAAGVAPPTEPVVATVEARLLLARLSQSMTGQVHLLGFVDAGHVTIDKRPWYVGDNSRDLGSAGVGIGWDAPGSFGVRTYYASTPGGDAAMSAPDKGGRFWIQAVKSL